ncbi:hypothetical protein DXG01_001288 [Tephrocybe rancida]|nr:hypothetical protein DXG01_001288 [Tephrocybe rancida]
MVEVLGQVGAGKSTFINHLVGREVAPLWHSITSEAVPISTFTASHFGQRVILVDTPGFDNILLEDWEIVQKISEFIKSLTIRGKPKTRKLAVFYLVDIDQPRRPIEALGRLCISGIQENLVILTTKWGNLPRKDIGRQWEESLAAPGRTIRSFKNVPESGWAIINNIPRRSVNISDFQQKLSSAIPAPRPPSKRRSTGLFARLFSLSVNPDKPSDSGTGNRNWTPALRPGSWRKTEVPALDVGTGPGLHESGASNGNILPGLTRISERLATAFKIKREYKKLLCSRGPDAQDLLDTFQMILSFGQPEERLRRDLVVATRRLSSKTDLYPRRFVLEGVERRGQEPVLDSGYADIFKGVFKGKPAIAREAILWGQLSHPNLLPFYGMCRIGQRLALVSPWASNGTIVEYLKSAPAANRILLCLDVAKALAYLHDSKVVHGDLKGANILVDGYGHAYLSDFGLSGIHDPDILHWASQSTAVSKGGTTRWQAPELFKPEQDTMNGHESDKGFVLPNTKASDVYALAWLLPFYEYHRDAVIIQKVSAGSRPSRPAELKHGLTDSIWTVMISCWDSNASNRPAVQKIVSHLLDLRTDDHRPPREWKPELAEQPSGFADSDLPLTIERLDMMIPDDRAARLQEISNRLQAVFNREEEYRQILTCAGAEAQAILDTFQLILELAEPGDPFRHNIIVAAQRLASLTDLYPHKFCLSGIEQVDDVPVANGAHADIYKGRMHGQLVCLKMIYVLQSSKQEDIVKASAQEALLWGQLSHANIIPIYGIHRFGQRLALVAPWTDEGNVLNFLASTPDVQRSLLCSDVAQGVAYLHHRGIVHGDLKGLNILIDSSHRARIGGFGCSAIEDPDILYWEPFSRPASMSGSIRWQGPELFEEDPTLSDSSLPMNTKATDVYAWGCVCYEGLSVVHVQLYLGL